MVYACQETLLPLRALAERLPGNKGTDHLHYETVRRWVKVGVRGIRLESKVMGGKRVSSLPAVDRFMDRLTQLEDLEAGFSSPEQYSNSNEPLRDARSY